jgi:hypothetical protein
MKQSAAQASHRKALALAGVSLQDDERIVAKSVVHGAIYWKAVAVIIIGMLLLPTFMMSLGLFLMFVGAVMLGLSCLTRRFLLVLATDKRIIVRSGIFYADMIELRYGQVESVELGITPIGQIFGYGSLIITGTGQRRIIVPFVSNAFEFRARVNDILVNK